MMDGEGSVRWEGGGGDSGCMPLQPVFCSTCSLSLPVSFVCIESAPPSTAHSVVHVTYHLNPVLHP